MKIVGIIAEYNPFHKGHEFHIEKAKKITGADAVIVVMSGDYVQRGMPAIMPKHLRAQMALTCGADVVLELPVCYAAGSAEYFATGAFSLLNSLGCVDYLCFGSECGNLDALQTIGDVLCQEPDHYKILLQKYLKEGNAFPAARKLALTEYLNENGLSTEISNEEFAGILDSPNNILGIEYLKAISGLNSSIKPVTITREGAGYHDQTLGSPFSSASAIRQGLQKHEPDSRLFANAEHAPDIDFILQELPENCRRIFKENYHKCFPVFADDFSLLLKAKLLSETKESLTKYLDLTPEIANRILSHRNDFISFGQFCDLIKTKNMTYSRISRCLIHILLDICKCDVPDQAADSRCGYARLLGFRKESSEVLSTIKKCSTIPLITKLPRTDEKRSDESMSSGEINTHMLRQNIFASDLYESVVTDKYHISFKNEYQKQIVRI